MKLVTCHRNNGLEKPNKLLTAGGVCIFVMITLSALTSHCQAQAPRTSVKKVTTSATASSGTKPQSKVVPLRPVLSGKEIFEKYKSSVVTVRTTSGFGTGFVFGSGVLTCYHVIDGARSVAVEPNSAPSVNSTYVWSASKEADVAYLRLDTAVGMPLKVSVNPNLKVGDPLYVIGNPEGLKQSLTEGILSGRRTVGEIEILQLSAAISPGSSGSPVFDKYGEVVGLVTGSITSGQQLNFAVSSSSALSFMQGVPLNYVFRSDTGLNLSNPQVQKLLVISPSTLQQVHDIVLEIADFPDAVGGAFSKDNVRKWVETELARAAPNLVIVTKDLQKQRFAASNSTELTGQLERIDDFVRTLTVNIGYGTDKGAKVNWYSIRMDFSRGGLLTTGVSAINAWGKGLYGVFGENSSTESIIKGTVEKLANDFGGEWSRANKK